MMTIDDNKNDFIDYDNNKNNNKNIIHISEHQEWFTTRTGKYYFNIIYITYITCLYISHEN